MKTLQLVGDSTFGGATRLIIDWCDYIISRGGEVDVLSTDERTITELKKNIGITIRDDIYIPREIDLMNDFSSSLKLLKLLQNEQYDVVHTYSATPGFLGRLMSWVAHVPVILHHQAGWTVNEAKSPISRIIYESLEGFSILISSKSICVSHAIAQQAKLLPLIPKRKLVTICNGIDVQKFNGIDMELKREELCTEKNINPNTVLIGNTGRLASQKDNSTLIKSLAELKRIYPSRKFNLLLAGDGPERAILEELVSSLGLKEDVTFLGFWSDIPGFLSGIDIFVSTSLWEGLSISILEAMAARKPIVASSIPPNSELIDHEKTGLLVSPKSPIEFAHAIQRLVDHPNFATQCAQAAQKKVTEKYTIDRMFDETYQLYVDLLVQKRMKSRQSIEGV